MELAKTRYAEPYSPENTPMPPQIIDPSGRMGNHDWARPAEESREHGRSRENKSPQRKDKR